MRWLATAAGYDTGTGRALRRSKYAPDRAIAVRLARGFATAMRPVVARGDWDVLVAAPTTDEHLVQRGFSVPELLAARLSETTQIPHVDALRISPGPRQAALTLLQRRVRAQARIRAREATVATIDGKRVLLVDDVVTTGATAAACARELLGSGARCVGVATLCATRPAGAGL